MPLYVNRGKAEPIFKFYSRQCLPKWKQLIEQGIIKLQELGRRYDLLKIDIPKNRLFVGLLFTNINDKNDFYKALK